MNFIKTVLSIIKTIFKSQEVSEKIPKFRIIVPHSVLCGTRWVYDQ